MNADPKKPIEVHECLGPKPAYLLSAERGDVSQIHDKLPGPFEATLLCVYFVKWHGVKGRSTYELLFVFTFCGN